MEKALKKLEEFQSLEVENVNLPCEKCKGDCCGNDVIFNDEELAVIEQNTSLKKFKKNRLASGYTLSTKGVRNEKCVFLKNGKCSIYKFRPKICQDYGVKIYIQCPYNGLKDIPSCAKERTKLTMKVQNIFFSKMEEIYGFKLNMVPATAKNVIIKNGGKK